MICDLKYIYIYIDNQICRGKLINSNLYKYTNTTSSPVPIQERAMVVFTYADEFTSPVSPARLFKALILDARNLIPKIIPSVVTSIEIVEGDGLSAGSIRKINFVEGNPIITNINNVIFTN